MRWLEGLHNNPVGFVWCLSRPLTPALQCCLPSQSSACICVRHSWGLWRFLWPASLMMFPQGPALRYYCCCYHLFFFDFITDTCQQFRCHNNEKIKTFAKDGDETLKMTFCSLSGRCLWRVNIALFGISNTKPCSCWWLESLAGVDYWSVVFSSKVKDRGAVPLS